ncbi:HDA2 (YDR295C) [Zygosaccharomyces parabailii]|nr:HDA2 (YDR295C) [Zygosaccharomyces parabailii]CDH10434.1 related to HDA1 complex subunit 2 [Zygosaccharomyces bailii ISA1307]
MNHNTRKLHVFYLPIGLTPFQRDLTEILVSLHARSFQKELESDGDDSDDMVQYPQISTKQLTYMLDKGIRVVANHPCLLVDHYMPRQFLRMEPTESLVTTSDKFQKLQELLSHFIQRDRKEFPDILKICIISHNVRELDILEGLVLGKRMRIKRLSGTSLYDEKHVFPMESSDASTDLQDSKDGTPNNESSSNKYTGYSRDDYDYSLKRKMRPIEKHEDDWLFLTTTTHLLNDPELMKGYNVDYTISFDPSLDPSLPALENLKGKGKKKSPLIKLLVKDSPDHFFLKNPLPEGANKYEHLKAAIKHFLLMRHITFDNLPCVNHQEVVSALLKGEVAIPSLAEMSLSDVPKDASLFQLAMTKLETDHNTLTIDEKIFDMKSYQSELNKRTLDRLHQVQKECRHRDEILARKRLNETDRQNYLDETREGAGNVFKKFQNTEKSIIDSEKRLERCKTESAKLDEKISSLDEEIKELKRITSLEDASQEIYQYTDRIWGFKNQLKTLLQDNSQKNQRNDALRSNYQQKSSQAAEQAQCLKVLKNTAEQLQKDVDGPALRTQTNSLLSQEERLKNELASLKSRSKFLKSYVVEMTNYYSLKLSAGDDALSNRPQAQNGRPAASRYRSTRSNTPAYT